MASKKIGQLSQADTLTGNELLVFAKSGDNGAVPANTVKEYVKDGLAISDVAGLQTSLDAKAAKTDLQSISTELAERKKQFGKVGYVNTNIGEFTNNNGYRNSWYVPINRTLPINVYGVGTPNIYAIAFFDANFNFISGIAYPANSTVTTITCEAADIPANAVYFVASTSLNSLNNSYYTNGETIESRENATSDAIAEAKKALFIDEWNQMCCNGAIGNNVEKIGGYNSETGYFELNGITDIDYYEALRIYQYALEYPNPTRIDNINIRTNLIKQSTISMFDLLPNIKNLFRGDKLLTCRISNESSFACRPSVADSAFLHCPNLHTVYGIVDLGLISKSTTLNLFNKASFFAALKDMKIRKLKQGFELTQAPNLSLESMQYLINNAANTTPITIEVHPSMYAKLTGGSGQYNLIKASNVEIDATAYVMGHYNYDDLETIKPGVKYKLTLCYQLGDKDDKLVASMTAGYGNDTGFDTKSATAVIETKVRDYSAVSNAKQVNFSFYRLPNDNDFDPNTKVLWAVCVPDDGSDTPITEWIPAISELPEAEQEAAKWRQVNQLAAARGITFITAE